MKIFIMGAGKIGSWLAEEFCQEHEVAVYDTDMSKLKFFFDFKRISKIEDVKDFDPELAINCVGISHTREAFDELLPFLSDKCIIADMKSVKGDLAEFYAESKHRFVSVHPMFGPTFGNLKNLKGENAIIISESCEEGKEFFRALFGKLELKIFDLTFAAHDEIMSYSLSIPFASSLVFAACMDKLEAPGTTFKKHHEIAKGLLSEDDSLLAEIMFNPESLAQIEKINNKLNYLCHIIKGKDYEEMTTFLNQLRTNIK